MSVMIGGTLDATIEITNNTAAVINGETLKIHDIFDKADYLDNGVGCTLKNVQYGNGADTFIYSGSGVPLTIR